MLEAFFPRLANNELRIRASGKSKVLPYVLLGGARIFFGCRKLVFSRKHLRSSIEYVSDCVALSDVRPKG